LSAPPTPSGGALDAGQPGECLHAQAEEHLVVVLDRRQNLESAPVRGRCGAVVTQVLACGAERRERGGHVRRVAAELALDDRDGVEGRLECVRRPATCALADGAIEQPDGLVESIRSGHPGSVPRAGIRRVDSPILRVDSGT
jgi:hypothetical protein